jgi:hypothetical protein
LLSVFAASGALAGDHKISGCTIITEPGNYLLTSDIVVDQTCENPDIPEPDVGYVGIQIAASNVHLNLGGHTIYGDPAGYGDGFARGIDTSGSEVEVNVSISNGRVDGMGAIGDGIYIQGTKHLSITNVESTGNGRFGMGLVFCEACTVTASAFRDNGNAGVQTVFAGDADSDGVSDGPIRMVGNEFTGSATSNGITIGFFGGRHEIIGNTISNNGFNGIGEFLNPDGGNLIRGNTIEANGFAGLRLCTDANTIQANQVLDNGGNGIEIVGGFPCRFGPPGAGNLIQANRVVGSIGLDASDGNAGCVNTWKANTFDNDSEGDGPKAGCIQ